MTKGALLISEILKKQWETPLTDEERLILEEWLKENPENAVLLQQMASEPWLTQELDRFKAYDDTESRIKVKGILDQQLSVPAPNVHRVHLLRTAWFRYASALLLIAATATFLYRINTSSEKAAVKQLAQQATSIQPGGNKAMLTLADGSTIILDSAANGNLVSQGGIKILKLDDGALAYSGEGQLEGGEALYNTISTPIGGQYQIALSDGTKVWLNASSSIRFPTTFSKERTVDITGEAYLEVSANKNSPFIVKSLGTTIEVLGTSFNVNAYKDEAGMQTTLLDGSVRVKKADKQFLLKPGQQANVVADNAIQILNDIDVRQVVAWKNGYFDFNNADVPVMMRQLERWYDIQVTYVGNLPDVIFKGKMDRNVELTDVVRFLKSFGIKTELQGRRLIISGA